MALLNQGLRTLHLADNAIELRKKGNGIANFEYGAERERGAAY